MRLIILFTIAVALTVPIAKTAVRYDFSYTATSGRVKSFSFSLNTPTFITAGNAPTFSSFTITDGTTAWIMTTDLVAAAGASGVCIMFANGSPAPSGCGFTNSGFVVYFDPTHIGISPDVTSFAGIMVPPGGPPYIAINATTGYMQITVTLTTGLCLPPSNVFPQETGAYKPLIDATVAGVNLRNPTGEIAKSVELNNKLALWLSVSSTTTSTGPPYVPPQLVPDTGAGLAGITAKFGLVPPCTSALSRRYPFFTCTPQSSAWTASFCNSGTINLTVRFNTETAMLTALDFLAALADENLSPAQINSLVTDLQAVPDFNAAVTCLASITPQSSQLQVTTCFLSALGRLAINPSELVQFVRILNNDGLISFTLQGIKQTLEDTPTLAVEVGESIGDEISLFALTNGTAQLPITISGQ